MQRRPCCLPRDMAGLPARSVALRTFRHLSSSACRQNIPNTNIASILAKPPSDPPSFLTAVGFVRTIRNQKQHSFLELGDGSTIHSLQALLKPPQAAGLGTGTSVAITGLWKPCPKGKEQLAELEAHDVQVVGRTDAEKYPIQKKYHTVDFLRTVPHLRLRTPSNALLARLRSECDYTLAQYFRQNGFIRVQPPIITSSDCEGAGEVFSVLPAGKAGKNEEGEKPEHFFKQPKYLTVSSQLHLEAFIHEHQRVWTLSPTFRAEKSDTPRHVSEFWMLEAEMWTEKLEDLLTLVEDMIQDLLRQLSQSGFLQELVQVKSKTDSLDVEGTHIREVLEERWYGLLRSPWPRISYGQAIKILEKAVRSNEMSFQHSVSWGKGLSPEHERYIAACVGEGSPVFVTDYPLDIKPFYMTPSKRQPAEEDPITTTAACFDLLLPDGCEAVGGSLREHRFEHLVKAIRARSLYASSPASVESSENVLEGALNESPSDKSDLDWYLDLRRYGSVPHGGFGLGFDRLLGYLTGLSNIRDVVTWPRYYGRCDG